MEKRCTWLWACSPDLVALLCSRRFLTKGGVMILATWLSQAASEEQTSVLDVILKVYNGSGGHG